MKPGIREYLLLLFAATAFYEFVRVLLYTRALIRMSERVGREGRLVYSGQRQDPPLKAAVNGVTVTGEPGEIYETKNGRLILLNFFSAGRGKELPERFVFLAGLFFLLAEEHFRKPALYAIFEHEKKGKSFRVENTDELKESVRRTVLKARPFLEDPLHRAGWRRSHRDAGQCRNCSFRTDCTEALLTSSASSPARPS